MTNLAALPIKSTEQQVQNLMDKLEKEQAKVKERGMELLATQEELKKTQESLALALDKLEATRAPGWISKLPPSSPMHASCDRQSGECRLS